jgi:hypothetical protein
MTFPDPDTAESCLRAAEARNPGPWTAHSRNVAEAARSIAECHPELDPDRAFILGLLHDIGRREGVTGMRHVYDGYRYLLAQGWPDAARICLTHSFPYKDVRAGSSEWDCSRDELAEIEAYLAEIDYDRYDELIQLCDSIALPDGFCLMEKRLVDVVRRYRILNEFTLLKWEAYFAIKDALEARIGTSIYDLLPGVVETTFR